MLSVYFEESCGPALRAIVLEGAPTYFQVAHEPGLSDIILFQRDDWAYLRQSKLMRQHPDKCICVSDWDKPSFFIPGVYASNEKCWLTNRRTETTNYFFHEGGDANEYVKELSDHPIEKIYLYSFMGKQSSRVRKRLVRYYVLRRPPDLPKDILVEATDQAAFVDIRYNDTLRRRYAEILASSKYALCPRGWGTSSVRLFEACQMGIAPVILSDRWIPIGGIDWSFALFVDEGQVRDLDGIIRSHESEWLQRGQHARQTFLRHLTREAAPWMLAESLVRLTRCLDPRREAALRRWYPLVHFGNLVNDRLMKWFPAFRP